MNIYVEKIFNIDSKKISKHIQKNSVDFIVTSPPYWNLRDYGYKGQIGYRQSYKEYLKSMKKVVLECYKVLKDGRFFAINIGTIVSNEGMKLIAADFLKIFKEVGFVFRKDIIWHKPKGTTKWQRGATQFIKKPYPLMFNTNINHEYILIFKKGNNETLLTDEMKEYKLSKQFIKSMAYSVWDIKPVNSPKNDEKHVAPFPEELPKRLIRLFTFPGEIVLDPFAGCGTTSKVAKELGRGSIAVEMSKTYCSLIKNKLALTNFDSHKINFKQEEDEVYMAIEKIKAAKVILKNAKSNYKRILEKKQTKLKF